MATLTNMQIPALEVWGGNYLSWVLDAKMHLQAMSLEGTIVEGNEASLWEKSKAMVFLRRHIHKSLKAQYLTVEDPLILWSNLKERFDYQRDISLPNGKHEWLNLRFQDYARVFDYDSLLFRVSLELQLCGVEVTDKDMLEKTLITFHASNIVLQQ